MSSAKTKIPPDHKSDGSEIFRILSRIFMTKIKSSIFRIFQDDPDISSSAPWPFRRGGLQACDGGAGTLARMGRVDAYATVKPSQPQALPEFPRLQASGRRRPLACAVDPGRMGQRRDRPAGNGLDIAATTTAYHVRSPFPGTRNPRGRLGFVRFSRW